MKRFSAMVLVVGMLSLGGGAPVFAQGINDSFGSRLDDVIVGESGYQNIEDPITALPAYVGFLIGWTAVIGIVMLVQLVWAGYEYMTATGDSDKVGRAKKRIRNVVFATILLAAGYIIATFVAYAWGAATGYGS